MIHDNIVAAPELASDGLQKIEWVRRNMPILKKIQSEFEVQQPFVGKRITVCIHLEAKTAYLALVLRSGGAEVSVTGSNPESTKDDVVAALAEEGLKVYARHGAKPQEMRKYMEMALEIKPQLVIDDGGDLVEILHENQTGMLEGVIGACEETTTGVLRAQAREKAGQLQFPVMLVNEARCKYLFDNVHGTGQSVWDAVMRSTNLVLAGKTVVIVGYGWCGRGCAMRAQGLGASVIVCEVDPVKACDALMNGCRVMPLLEACAEADVVLSVTGVRHTLCKEHFHVLKDNALLANAGHFWEEIDTPGLKEISVDKQQMRTNVDGFQMQDGRWLNLLGNGNIVNIACADGHPAEIMDTSFALQALSARHLVEHANVLEKRCYPVPGIIDERVARIRLQSSGVSYDTLTEDQQQYLSDWEA